jgi:hypothetical protein
MTPLQRVTTGDHRRPAAGLEAAPRPDHEAITDMREGRNIRGIIEFD